MSDALLSRRSTRRQVPVLHRQHRHRASAVGLDMSSNEHPVTRSVYVVVLDKDCRRRSRRRATRRRRTAKEQEGGRPKDDNKDEEARRTSKAKDKPVVVKIDLDGIDQRILPADAGAELRRPARRQERRRCSCSKGPLVITESDCRRTSTSDDGARFDLEQAQGREVPGQAQRRSPCPPTARRCCTSRARVDDRGHRDRRRRKPKPGEGALKLDGMEVRVDPRASGGRCTTRPGASSATSSTTRSYHGLDLAKAEKKYEPYLDGLGRRARPELPVRGDARRADRRPHVRRRRRHAGAEERSRAGCSAPTTRSRTAATAIARVYSGENWNPELQAPLTQPGVNVRRASTCSPSTAGSCARATTSTRFFEETAGKQVVLKVGPNADGTGARDVTVVPGRRARRPAAPGLDRRQPPQGRRADRRQGGLRLPAGHRRRGLHAASTATSSPRSASRRRSSTSASTAAGSWPTTSSITCAGRS